MAVSEIASVSVSENAKTGNVNTKAETACKMKIARAMTAMEMLFLSVLRFALELTSISMLTLTLTLTLMRMLLLWSP